MSSEQYERVPLDENDVEGSTEVLEEKKGYVRWSSLKDRLFFFVPVIAVFAIGFVARGTWVGIKKHSMKSTTNGLLSPQSFLPEIPIKEVVFNFPTDYDVTGELGNRLWNELMPLGSGLVRVPHPHKYDMPPSKKIENDPEDAEIYSMSITHQLHCLGMIRHVIMEYEKGSKSRFAGDGHEYHCLDYIRQAVLCAGDTTLDHAAIIKDADGSERRSDFTGANSTHQCRDWEAIKSFLIDRRSGDKTGIL